VTIGARDAVVPEPVRQSILQQGENLANLAESVAEFAVDLIGGEKLKILARLLQGEWPSAEDWEALDAARKGGRTLSERELDAAVRELGQAGENLAKNPDRALRHKGPASSVEAPRGTLVGPAAGANAPEGAGTGLERRRPGASQQVEVQLPLPRLPDALDRCP
jgi:hypothetical protein